VQVTIGKVFHSYVYVIAIIVPAKGLDKAPLVLDTVSSNRVVGFHNGGALHTPYYEKTGQWPPTLGNNHWTQLSASSLQLVLSLCYPLGYRFVIPPFRTHHGLTIFPPFEPSFASVYFQTCSGCVGHALGRNGIESQAWNLAQCPEWVS
jgi:hypothetical protein